MKAKRIFKSICAVVVVTLLSSPLVAQQRDLFVLSDVVRLAAVAGTPLVDRPGPTDAVDFDGSWSRLLRIYTDRGPVSSDPDLTNAWSDVRQKTLDCMATLTAIAKIDDVKPSGWDIFMKTMRNNQTDSQKFDRNITITERLLAEGSKLIMQQQFRDKERDLYNSIGALRRVGDRFTSGTSGRGIAMGYQPAWRGVYRGDILRLRNDSGYDFDNAAVAVIFQSGGRSFTHLHHVDRWPVGAVMGAWYSYAGDTYSGGKAFDAPATIEVAVYSTTVIATSRVVVSQEDIDDDVRDYCSHLTISGNFLGEYTENGSGQYFAPGLQFSFDGLGTLPVKSVLIRLYADDATSKEVIWRGDRDVHSRSTYAYRSVLFTNDTPSFSNRNAPTHIEIVLEFEGTSYRHAYRFY